MSELLPCPFCGGEAVGYEWSDDDELEEGEPHADCAYCAVAANHKKDCLLAVGEFCMWIAPTEEEAAEIWNTRAERTCHLDTPICDWETGEVEYRCSECGFEADPQNWALNFRYCPNCGGEEGTIFRCDARAKGGLTMQCTMDSKKTCDREPTRAAYERGCRCDAAKQANRAYLAACYGKNRDHLKQNAREYKKRIRESTATICPMCGNMTSRLSGFCKRCEAQI